MVVDKKQFFFKNLCRIKIEKENKIKDWETRKDKIFKKLEKLLLQLNKKIHQVNYGEDSILYLI
jgi:hypothetical protein